METAEIECPLLIHGLKGPVFYFQYLWTGEPGYILKICGQLYLKKYGLEGPVIV